MSEKQKRWNWRDIGLPGPTKVRVNGKAKWPIRLYRVWNNIKLRVSHCPSVLRDRHAKYYAQVTLCEEWRHFPSFMRWAMSHGYRDDLTIDRIDGTRGYCPENCRWATYSEQNRNRHYTEAFRLAVRRNWQKAQAVLAAKRKAMKEGAKCG